MAELIELLIFTRYPRPGEVKSRLLSALGPEKAARLQQRMCEEVVGTARGFRQARQAGRTRLTVCTTGAGKREFRAWLGPDLNYRRQGRGELGERLSAAMFASLRPRPWQGGNPPAQALLMVGADLPGLNPALLQQAADELRNHDVVLGPALDGGYYLIGLKAPQPRLFRGIDWGSEQVREQTRTAIERLGLKAAILPPLGDIDRPEDLAPLYHDHRFSDLLRDAPPLISVIIPTLNEARHLGATLAALAGGSEVEIIVADGGSVDHTHRLAAAAGAVVLRSQPGRARQQNRAADRAKGRYLLFLHADTFPPHGYDRLIRQALDDPATVAGAFSLAINGRGSALRLMEWGANLRSRRRRLPYGDQGIFLKKRIFNEAGGFSELPIMEDYELMDRLRRRGRIITLEAPALTSARRWQKLGVWRTMLLNQAMIIGFRTGVSPEKLAAIYRLFPEKPGSQGTTGHDQHR